MPLPTVILPGYLASATVYRDLEQELQNLGFPIAIVPLLRRTWLPTIGGRSMLPILSLLDATVHRLMQETGSDRINLIGHSAGGWISRIYLGETPYDIHLSDSHLGESGKRLWKAHPAIATLVTLGTPHVSQERWTKRNLDFVKNYYPGAFHPGVRYACVAGKAILGEQRWGKWFAYSSYELTCGRGNVWGDGITPIEAAHLEGAENIVLDNVFHSPRPGMLWYGSPEAVSVWAKYLA